MRFNRIVVLHRNIVFLLYFEGRSGVSASEMAAWRRRFLSVSFLSGVESCAKIRQRLLLAVRDLDELGRVSGLLERVGHHNRNWLTVENDVRTH